MHSQINLLYQITKASFKTRNASSMLGVLWYLLGPLLMFIVLLEVFSERLGGNINNYPLYLLSGIIMWNFFSSSTSQSINSVMSQAGLIKALSIRREMLVLSVYADVFVSHIFEIVIFIAIVFFFGVNSLFMLFFPIVVILNLMFALGVGFALSALYFIFRDIGQIWSIVMRIWWFATPVFYKLEGGTIDKFNKFNPMFYVLDIARDVLIYAKAPNMTSLIILSFYSIVSLIIGIYIFKKVSPHFAEYV